MIHIYTGDGKGKTTAAVGLTLRALGAGKRVAFFQFMKAWPSSEIDMLQNLGVIVDRSWDGKFITNGEPSPKQKRLVLDQYQRALKIMRKSFDMIVLDEIVVTTLLGLLQERDILALMEQATTQKEIILTGRGATPKMIDKADLVTEMKKIKHYFDKGVPARKGIEF